MSDSDDKFLTGAQAAEFLGVKAATLYAYASRGLIESIQASSGRERSYRLSELVRLRNSARGIRTAKDSEPAVWTGPLIKSSITELKEDGHRYRGLSALKLAAENKPFELVAEILWDTDVGSLAEWTKSKPFSLPKQLKKMISSDADYLDLLKLVLASLEATEAISPKLLADDIMPSSRRLIISMAIIAGYFEKRETFLSSGKFPIAQTLLSGITGGKSTEKAEAINRALVLCADHELNASALAARIAASCDATLFSCLLSALGTFSGSMHGAASRRAEDIISNSLKFKSASAWLKDYMKNAERIPGFGTDLYEGGDPRAKLLIETARSVSSKNKYLMRLIDIVDCVRDQIGAEPNLDVGLAAISYGLSLTPGSGSSIFAVSRSAGWIAHAIEQRMYGGVIRPRAKYIGRL